MKKLFHIWTKQGVCGRCKRQEPDPFHPDHNSSCPGFVDPVRVILRQKEYTNERVDAINTLMQCLNIARVEAANIVRDLFSGTPKIELVVDRSKLDALMNGLSQNGISVDILTTLSPLTKKILSSLDKNPEIRSEVLFALTYGLR